MLWFKQSWYWFVCFYLFSREWSKNCEDFPERPACSRLWPGREHGTCSASRVSFTPPPLINPQHTYTMPLPPTHTHTQCHSPHTHTYTMPPPPNSFFCLKYGTIFYASLSIWLSVRLKLWKLRFLLKWTS